MFAAKARRIEKDIDAYLYSIQKSGLIFHEAIKDYLNNDMVAFIKRVEEIRSVEHDADLIRKNFEHKLYAQMLIPEYRGDVLGLFETLDDISNIAKQIIVNFDIERPEIPDFLKPGLLRMAEHSKVAIEELVKAVHAFFSNIRETGSYIEKVNFYEHEVDKLQESLKREVFSSKAITGFGQKMHLRYFIEKTARLSDCAEDVCSRLAISVIKRSI